MTRAWLSVLCIVSLALIAALFAACSSDEPAPADQQQASAGPTASADEQRQSQQSAGTATANESTAGDDERQSTASRSAPRRDADDEPAQSAQSEEDSSGADSQPSRPSVQRERESDPQDEPEQQSAAQESQESQQPQAEQAEEQQDQQSTEPVGQSESDEPDGSEQDDQAEQAAQQAQPREPTRAELLQQRAAEISAQATAPDLVGLNGWLNGEETTVALELAKGNVVLIDFWTYTCINCVRTLPFLTAWDEKYREHGLVILGVHTPEFEFEKVPANIRGAIDEYGIEYNVPMDNDFRTWRAFNNRFWPAKYLIGPTADGSPMGVRYFHFGEGHYPETELEIRAALEAVGRDLTNVPIGVDVVIPTREANRPRQTRELYAGWRRNVGSGGPYAAQEAYFLTGTGIDTLYRDVDTSDREHNRWYLEGLWRTESQSIVHARETDDLDDYIALLVRGRTANVVLTVAEDGQPFNVYVELDGRWLFPNEAGAHVQWDDHGRSFIRVTENDLYRLLYLPEWSEHELRLRSDSDQFRIFAFTFGSYVGGE